MMTIGRVMLAVAATGSALALAGCSSASSMLSTGALFGSDKPKVAAAPAPETPADRALHVATTSANAKRCGYVFDPNAVRSQYVTFEASQGGAPDQAAKAEKFYDDAFGKVTKLALASEDFCSEGQTAVIKRDLTKVLAGDFSAPAKKPDVGLFSDTREKLDREKVFNPQHR